MGVRKPHAASGRAEERPEEVEEREVSVYKVTEKTTISTRGKHFLQYLCSVKHVSLESPLKKLKVL